MKFLVIGDSCTDKFKYGDCDRICPEAPVPVFNPVEEISNGGMAKNVQANVEAHGVECDIFTNKNHIIKSRYVDMKTNQMLLRVDENDHTKEKFEQTPGCLEGYDGVIVSDYNKGFLTNLDIAWICKSHPNTFVHSKKNFILPLGRDMRFFVINQQEYEKSKEHYKKDNEDFDNVWMDKLIVTQGEKGCRYQKELHPSFKAREVQDLSGAGDTFLASFAVNIMSCKSASRALDFANKCASRVVAKRGVTTV
jgi:bifunctional ADP-heptose synthase (sugar kinase/adenylyltransferase)